MITKRRVEIIETAMVNGEAHMAIAKHGDDIVLVMGTAKHKEVITLVMPDLQTARDKANKAYTTAKASKVPTTIGADWPWELVKKTDLRWNAKYHVSFPAPKAA